MRVTPDPVPPRRARWRAFVVAAALVAGCSSSNGLHSGPVGTASNGSSPATSAVQGTVATTLGGSTSPSAPSSAVTSPAISTGPSGVGDSLFPDLGNPGIDVDRYDIDLAYDPPTNRLRGTVTLSLRFTTALSVFTLDSEGPQVSAVTVDGVAAVFRETSPELVVTPPTPVTSPRAAVVTVTYSVTPTPLASPGGLTVGWYATPGGSYVLDEPDGARSWLPSNDHPSDKAVYRFRITVPDGLTAVANGALLGHVSSGGKDTWEWEERQPMATYLISVLTGRYDLVPGIGPHGLPLLHAVLHQDRAVMQPFLDVTAAQIAFFEREFGPYPLDRYGISITDSASGEAMETQERSLFSRDDFLGGKLQFLQQLLLSHELAHQWFGDAVTPARWKDIWLNESFATYAQWLWLDHVGLAKIDTSAATALAQRKQGSPADPTADELFAFNSYSGGAVVLHALRRTIGDDAFFEVLRTWVQTNRGRSRTTDDFVSLAERISGRDLSAFFATWLYSSSAPTALP